MIPVVHRFCGIQVPHYAHVFYRGHGDFAGSANYTCVGWTYENSFQEVKEWNG